MGRVAEISIFFCRSKKLRHTAESGREAEPQAHMSKYFNIFTNYNFNVYILLIVTKLSKFIN